MPLVEFTLEEGISHQEAIQLIASPVDEEPTSKATSVSRKDQWQEERFDQYQTLTLDNTQDEEHFDVDRELGQYYSPEGYDGGQESAGDPFTLTLDRRKSVDTGVIGSSSHKIIASRSVLKQLKKSEVLIGERRPPLGYSYYRNLVPDMNVSMCSSCCRFFLDDMEVMVLLEGCCPFCRKESQDCKK